MLFIRTQSCFISTSSPVRLFCLISKRLILRDKYIADETCIALTGKWLNDTSLNGYYRGNVKTELHSSFSGSSSEDLRFTRFRLEVCMPRKILPKKSCLGPLIFRRLSVCALLGNKSKSVRHFGSFSRSLSSNQDLSFKLLTYFSTQIFWVN